MDLSKLHLHWRASQYKGNSYRSYSLARAYRQNGKNRKEIVIKLGKLSDSEASKWRTFLQAAKNPDAFLTTLDDLVVIEHYAYLDVAVANTLWDEWKLNDIFKDNGKRNVAIATIARILAVNRCIDPASKSQTPEWFRTTALPWIVDVDPDLVNPSRIFRELAAIEELKEAICDHLFALIKQWNPDSIKSVFYDLSSTTFSGSRCVLMKWGHCKEGYHNHVVLAMVVSRDGLPFYWEVLPGGTADSKTIIWLLERLQDRFKVNGVTLVFDRGMVSEDNLILLEEAKIKYISAMDKNQIEGISDIDFTTFSYLTPDKVDEQASKMPGFTKLNKTTYYREVKLENNRRYILCFNPQLFKDQRNSRSQSVDDFKKFAVELNAELLTAKHSRQKQATYDKFKRKFTKLKLSSFVDVELRDRYIEYTSSKGAKRKILTYQATVIVDDTAMLSAGKLDGFWLLVTNHTEQLKNEYKLSASEAIKPYREKTVIESTFRDIKSFVEVEPVYVWTEDHVKAHYTICVLSHLINRTLTLRLHAHEGDMTKDIVSHEKLYKNLSGCQIDLIEVENVDLSTYNMTRPNSKQKELVKRVGLGKLLSRNIAEKVNSQMHP